MILVDSSVLLDVLTADPVWLPWSAGELQKASALGPLVVNPIVCAEIAPAFDFDWNRLEQWLVPSLFAREALPFEASVVAAKAHRAYRKRGGNRTSTLPDFFIGAHAEVARHTVLTRDARFRNTFPSVTLISSSYET